jgi:hypothetical protein
MYDYQKFTKEIITYKDFACEFWGKANEPCWGPVIEDVIYNVEGGVRDYYVCTGHYACIEGGPYEPKPEEK